jgi:hypothetical protein
MKELAHKDFHLITKEQHVSKCTCVKELKKNYTEHEHVMNMFMNFMMNIRSADSDINLEENEYAKPPLSSGSN